MSTLAELALVLDEATLRGQAELTDIMSAYSYYKQHGNTGMLGVERYYQEYETIARGNDIDWGSILLLIIYWRLDNLMSEGYFSSD